MVLMRSPVFVGLAVVLFLGVAVYFRLWTIDATYSREEAEIIRLFLCFLPRLVYSIYDNGRARCSFVSRSTHLKSRFVFYAYNICHAPRKQFDLANREAMEESAEWRLKYDEAVERSKQHFNELVQAKKEIGQKSEEVTKINKTLHMLQKENINLLERVESMTQELENEKLKCNNRQTQVK